MLKEIHRQVSVLIAAALFCTQPANAETGGRDQPSEVERCVSAINTPVSNTIDYYFGTPVADPYRWLEDWSDPAVKAWSEQQSECARQYLDALPAAPLLRSRIAQLLTQDRGTSYWDAKFRGGRMFILRKTADAQQPSLVWFEGADITGTPHIVLDPMLLDPSGNASLDWYVPSTNGELVAASLSSGGSESGTLRVFSASSGSPIEDESIADVSKATAGGDLAWTRDSSGFFYTRYPKQGERPDNELFFHQQLYYHALGTAADNDILELGSGLPPIAAIRLQADAASGRVIARVQDGDGGQFRFYLRDPEGSWRPLGNFGDGHQDLAFGPGDDLFLVTRAGTPKGKVVRLSAKDLDLSNAETVVEESDDALAHNAYEGDAPTITVAGNTLFLLYQLGGPTELRAFSLQGESRPGPVTERMSQVSSVTAVDSDEVILTVESFITPPHWVRYNAATGKSDLVQAEVDGSQPWRDVAVERVFAISRDGSRVPVSIMRKQDVPTRGLVLTGYGGFGIAELPSFRPQLRVLLEQGIAYAVANTRGGSEFGAKWHGQGNLENKQRVFDDFIAVAQHLVDENYAPPGKLAITGTSNGGLLMGAVLIQQPQLAQAVVANVGIFDLLRHELDPNGAFNVTEYGSIIIERQFRALLAYSPYHNVDAGDTYPPILMLTGANDNRVNPMHSRKMTARLQAANRSRVSPLLRTSGNTGHGLGKPTSARIEELTDIYSFIMHSLAIPYFKQDSS
jgi:prolyl oligopeptidase